jgi:hypothetical protein
MDTHPSPDAAVASLPPPVSSPEWLYDLVMRNIEPDLTSGEIPLLPERYADESPEDRIERMERYDRAFDLFDLVLQDLSEVFADAAREWKEEMQRHVQAEEAHERSTELGAAESQLHLFQDKA